MGCTVKTVRLVLLCRKSDFATRFLTLRGEGAHNEIRFQILKSLKTKPETVFFLKYLFCCEPFSLIAFSSEMTAEICKKIKIKNSMKQTNLLEFSLVMSLWFVDHKALHSYSYFMLYLLLYNTQHIILSSSVIL